MLSWASFNPTFSSDESSFERRMPRNYVIRTHELVQGQGPILQFPERFFTDEALMESRKQSHDLGENS